MKKLTMILAVTALLGGVAGPQVSRAQDAAPAAVADGALTANTDEASAPKKVSKPKNASFFAVVAKSGFLGIMLWLAILGAGGAAVYFVVDCAITVRPIRIMPDALVDSVTEAMVEGDVIKALECCENEPGPLANVLSSGFSHVEEGFDVIEEAIATSADLETEKIMQKLTWLSVVGNLAPMLGLLGTVQGMIAAFSNLAGGAPDVGVLALDISQALFTTAGGLTIAVPCVAFYYIYRNAANTIILRMEALTMELIKDLRNVEVVEE